MMIDRFVHRYAILLYVISSFFVQKKKAFAINIEKSVDYKFNLWNRRQSSDKKKKKKKKETKITIRMNNVIKVHSLFANEKLSPSHN